MSLAYFITFSTYGTWLHGTTKGLGSVDRNHNLLGAPFVDADAGREAAARERMTQPAYVMTAAERPIVRDAVVTLCRERGWQLRAVHVRTNHAHIVVTVPGDPGGDRVMADLKARGSRALTRAGFDDSDRKRWSRHGSTLYLHDAATVDDKIDYVLNRQGAPMALFDGATPWRAAHVAYSRSKRVISGTSLTAGVPFVRGSRGVSVKIFCHGRSKLDTFRLRQIRRRWPVDDIRKHGHPCMRCELVTAVAQTCPL